MDAKYVSKVNRFQVIDRTQQTHALAPGWLLY